MLEWAKRMTWKGLHPVVELSHKVYQKGITLGKAAMQAVEARLERHPALPKYDILYRSTVFWTPSDLKLCGIRQGTSLLMSHLGRGFVAMPSNQPSLIVLTLELVQR